MSRARVLYIFHKSLTETIPRLHGLSQVHALSSERPFTVVSFEPRLEERTASDRELYHSTRDWLLDAGVDHVAVPAVGTRWLEIPLGALAVLRQVLFRGVRIIHCRSYIPALMGMAVSELTPARLLFDMRGLFVDEYMHDGALREGTLKLAFVRWLERRLLATSDAIVAVSEAFRRHLLERPDLRDLGLGPRVHVIPNRVEMERFAEALRRREAARRDRGWQDSVVAVFIGSAAGWHRLDLTMEIMSDVMARLPNLRMAAAVYPDADEALRMAERASVPTDRLEVVTLPTEDVPPLLAAADLALMPAADHLSRRVCAPIKFSEYMAAGLPTAASEHVGDTQAWIEDEGLGVVIDQTRREESVSRITSFLTSEEFRTGRARQRCLDFARRELDMAETLTQYEAIYRELE